MPSFASGNSCCTAWASTCAVEWRRIDRPSGLPARTGSTTSPAASGYARSRSSPLTRAAITAAAPPSAGGLAAACPPAVSGPAAAPTAAPFGLINASPAVVPASTTCSLPARVMRSWLADTADSLVRAIHPGPALAAARAPMLSAPTGSATRLSLPAGQVVQVVEHLAEPVRLQGQVALLGVQPGPGPVTVLPAVACSALSP